MNYLSVQNVAKSFGDRMLFENISFGINKDQKIALIAKNGTGKTTLLNIIAGLETPDTGEVVYRKGLHTAYVAQKDHLNPNHTIEEAVFAADNPLLSIIQNYEKALENMEDTEGYQKAFNAMEQHQAWDFETHYKQILTKLQFSDLNTPIKNLSGGQRKRLSLAIALITKPDLLILDEPTNHLDLEMIEWLEAYFAKEKITLFMVTHDRYFLERVCNEIIEIDEGELYKYKGNYANYLQKKAERLAQEQQSLAKTKSLYKKELDWMRRQPKARTHKSKSRIDSFHEIKERAHKRRSEHEIQLEINMTRMGNKIIELEKVSKSYDQLPILKDFSYVFKRGERIGIIGKNGTGKSTFLNIITGKIPPDSGIIEIGETIKFGYYSQQGIAVKPGQKVIEVIQEFGDYIPLNNGQKISAGSLLERFLFDRKKQYDYVEKLSGGELKRLFLCTVLIQNPNFLILDEPTNDLDIVTLNILENFLLDFPGNLIVVSHDRYFMDKIVDHLFVFKGQAVIEDFPGNYSDYRAYIDAQQKARQQEVKPKKTQAKQPNLQRKTEKELAVLEKEINELTEQKNKIETQFNSSDLPMDEIARLSEQLQTVLQQLELKEEKWMELSMRLEEMEN